MSEPEVWLRGRVVEGIPALLQPVAHSLLQCREEIEQLLIGTSVERIWHSENASASIGFHVLHATGSLYRLFTYTRGSMLSDAQRKALAQESQPNLISPPRISGRRLTQPCNVRSSNFARPTKPL